MQSEITTGSERFECRLAYSVTQELGLDFGIGTGPEP